MRPAVRLAVLVLAALLLPAAAAAQKFEGTLHQRVVLLGPDQIATLTGVAAGDARPDPLLLFGAGDDRLLSNAAGTYQSAISFKGSKVRMAMPEMELADMPGDMAEMMKGAYTLFDVDAKEMTTIVPALERAMVTTAEVMAELRNDSVASLVRPADMKTRELGAATVSGVQTKTYEVVAGESVSHVWVAAELAPIAAALKSFTGSMMTMFGGSGPGDVLDRAAALFGEGLPVRTQTLTRAPTDPNGGPGEWSFFWSETSVDQAPLADSLFAVPAGFQVVRLPGGR